jgi:hypothetical protein
MTRVSLSAMGHRATAYVEAEVDVSLSDVSSEDLIAELEERGDLKSKLPKSLEVFPEGTMQDVLETLETNGRTEALDQIRKLLLPRWKSLEECEAAYKTARDNL